MGTPLFISVNGTGVPDPWGPGFSGDIGRALNNPWNDPVAVQFWGEQFADVFDWQPIGYPAAVFPMNPSVNAGVLEVSNQVTRHESIDCPPGTTLALSGYSQGAIVTGTFWRDYVLNPNGLHHNRINDIAVGGGIVNFGDPLRTPGIAHGNEIAGQPAPAKLDGVVTGGIAGPGDLTAVQTPDFLASCALDGDLYAAAPVGPPSGIAQPGGAPWTNEPLVGQVETRIYNFVETGSLLGGILSIAKGISQELEYPLSNTLALCYAIFNGLKFASAGTSAPHWEYGPFVPAMAEWLTLRAKAAL